MDNETRGKVYARQNPPGTELRGRQRKRIRHKAGTTAMRELATEAGVGRRVAVRLARLGAVLGR